MNKSELKMKTFGPKLTAYDQIKEELKVLKILEHPNVIFLKEIIDDDEHVSFYLVTSYYNNGSIGD